MQQRSSASLKAGMMHLYGMRSNPSASKALQHYTLLKSMFSHVFMLDIEKNVLTCICIASILISMYAGMICDSKNAIV